MIGLDGELSDRNELVGAKIRVIGVGGGGGNAINTMIASGLKRVEFLAANTDLQDLAANLAPTKIPLGTRLTRGLGAGGNPEIGRQAALEDVEALKKALVGADIVFLTAGMGGGTGTGAAPVVAQVAKESGALTIGVVTKPFAFEASFRMARAEEGIKALQEHVDALLIVPNERLASVLDKGVRFVDAFRRVDEVLLQAVRAIADLVTVHGLINLDYADVRAVMAEKGLALMGSAAATGEDRAMRAAQAAISCPLLEGVAIQEARDVLINITGSADLTLDEAENAANLVRESVHEDANIIFGAVIDETLSDEVRITVIATGFAPANSARQPQDAAPKLASQKVAHAAVSRQVVTPLHGRGEPRRKVFVGTVVDDSAGEPRLEPPAAAAMDRAGSADAGTDEPYVLQEESAEKDDLAIPAFLRRSRG